MMNTAAPSSSRLKKLWLRALLTPVILLVLVFVTAGRLDYWQGWTYVGISVFSLVLTVLVLGPNNPLISERLKPGAGVKGWDKLYFALSTPLYLVALLVAALDAGRFGWEPPVSWVVYLTAVLLYGLGQGLFLWSKAVNPFFSSVVRIQSERGQTVCREGPYRFVRHPGYVAGLFFGPTMPLLLGSWWGMIPAVLAALLLIWRTAREDQTLQEELPGYAAYADKVRYRLLPGVW